MLEKGKNKEIWYSTLLKDDDLFERKVVISEEEYNKLPDGSHSWGWEWKSVKSITDSYFTPEKILEMKKEVCKRIMESENPFEIYPYKVTDSGDDRERT